LKTKQVAIIKRNQKDISPEFVSGLALIFRSAIFLNPLTPLIRGSNQIALCARLPAGRYAPVGLSSIILPCG